MFLHVDYVMLLLLYITLDGCGLSSLSSLAAPVMIFSRQLNGNDSSNGDGPGDGEGNYKGQTTIVAWNW